MLMKTLLETRELRRKLNEEKKQKEALNEMTKRWRRTFMRKRSWKNEMDNKLVEEEEEQSDKGGNNYIVHMRED